jgi:hypothetical protein
MATFAFTTTSSTFTVSLNGSQISAWPRLNRAEDDYKADVTDDVLILSLKNPYYSAHITEDDTVTIGGETFEGTLYELSSELKDNVLSKEAPGAAAYSVYTALLTQIGTGAPTAVVLANTIGSIVWTRSSEGYYLATLEGAFPDDRTFFTLTKTNDVKEFVMGTDTPPDSLYIETKNGASWEDSNLSQTPVEIRVYPA